MSKSKKQVEEPTTLADLPVGAFGRVLVEWADGEWADGATRWVQVGQNYGSDSRWARLCIRDQPGRMDQSPHAFGVLRGDLALEDWRPARQYEKQEAVADPVGGAA